MTFLGPFCNIRPFKRKRISLNVGDTVAATPLGQVPVYTTADGEVLVQSNIIARYVAKKNGESLL